MRAIRRGAAVLAVLALAALVSADEVLVLKDGRRIPVTRLVRRDGQVVFQTAKGEVFSVPEGDVVSPPLESIPRYRAPEAPAQAQPQVLVLKDGRKIPVTRLARRGGLVLFQTAQGEAFSLPEADVVAPPLESIPSLEPSPAPPPSPAPSPPVQAPSPPPIPPVTARPAEFAPMPNRWDIPYPEDPRFVKGRHIDPYNQNVLKGDKPVIGDAVFLVLTGVLETPFERRRLPATSGVSTLDPGSREFFGRGNQTFTSPRALVSAELFKGQTAFRPKSFAIKGTAAFDLNYLRVGERNLVDIDVREGRTRRRQDFSLEEAFAEAKLADLSPQFDFVSLRAGIQPFVSDFRGFVFADSNLGARLFGNAAGNRWQYNAAWFDPLEKDTNSELNTFERRGQRVFVANLFRQDFLVRGYQLSLSYHRSQDEATTHYDANGFLVRPAKIGSARPHEIRANYVGLAGDGHLGRLNVSHACYLAFGNDSDQPLAGRAQDIRAHMAAAELSVDRDWLRLKASAFWASGDDDALDERARGFDSIEDGVNLAGGPFSFWSRSAIALTQTGVLLKAPGSLLPDLRSSKFEGQASFVNPGLLLLGVGVEGELTPKLKGVLSANYLRFDKTGALALLLFQPGIRKDIGVDLGAGFLWRPLLNENLLVEAGFTGLVPGSGFDDIYTSACGVPGCGAGSRKLFNGFVLLKLTY
ncbi:MAG: hypothetical protein DMF80_10130 [Acidobacteria bacterium]|nr:MAG: hypothetical protein DMF80_10130 [Acidobacteriota bacterium]